MHYLQNYQPENTEEILKAFCIVAPYINPLTVTEFAFSVCDREKYLIHVPSKVINHHIKPGDPVRTDSTVYEAMQKNKRTVRRVDKSSYGETAYIVIAMPIHDSKGNVISGAAQMEPVDRQNRLMQMATELDTDVNNIVQSIRSIAEQAEELTATVQNVLNDAKQAEEKAKQTDEFVRFVKKMADQSNILGLNALIESARAGEAGKGFAVVADEVRKLAMDSKNNAQNIGEMVKQIQESSHSIGTKIENVNNITTEQLANIEEISALIEQIKSMAQRLNNEADSMTKIYWE